MGKARSFSAARLACNAAFRTGHIGARFFRPPAAIVCACCAARPGAFNSPAAAGASRCPGAPSHPHAPTNSAIPNSPCQPHPASGPEKVAVLIPVWQKAFPATCASCAGGNPPAASASAPARPSAAGCPCGKAPHFPAAHPIRPASRFRPAPHNPRAIHAPNIRRHASAAKRRRHCPSFGAADAAPSHPASPSSRPIAAPCQSGKARRRDNEVPSNHSVCRYPCRRRGILCFRDGACRQCASNAKPANRPSSPEHHPVRHHPTGSRPF